MKLQIPTCHLLIRPAFKKYIRTDYDYNERVFVFYMLKLSIDIFIMSKLIKQAMISSLSAAGHWSLATLKNKNLHLTNKKMLEMFF